MPDPAPLRVGYVLKRFPRFSETFVLNEILALEERGVEVTVFSLLRPPDEPRHARLAALRAPVHILPRGRRPAAPIDPRDAALMGGVPDEERAALEGRAAALAALAAEAGIAHLHAHFLSDSTTVALLAARRLGGTVSVTAHARDIWRTYRTPAEDDARRRAKLREAAFAVTVSDANAAHLRALCPEAAGRIHRLHNGVDLTTFAPGGEPVPGRIVAVGRLVPKKGFPVLVEACALLRDRGLAFDCRIIGEGPERAALEAQVAAMGLGEFVTLGGALPQEALASLLAEGAVATLPCIVTEDGDRDGLPTVLLEAMAMGLPVVTTNVTGGPDIVAPGETGLLVEPGDAAALADALAALLSDPDRARAMGAAGRVRAERLFDLRRNAGRLLDLIAEVAADAAVLARGAA